MITNLRLQDYKNHRDTSFEFGRLTALVGPNSSGKTNVLDVLGMPFRLTSNGNLQSAFSDETEPVEIIRKSVQSCKVSLKGKCDEERAWALDITIDQDSFPSSGASRVQDTAFAKLQTSTGWEFQADSGGSVLLFNKNQPSPPWLELTFQGITLLQAATRHLQQPSFTNEIPPRISTYGAYLPSVIAHNQLQNRHWVEQLIARVRTVVPAVRDINIKQAHGVIEKDGNVRTISTRNNGGGDHIKKVDQLVFDFENASGIKAKHVSEGTLFATLIFAALMQYPDSDAPKTLLLDDIDQGLHPKAQRDLIGVLRKMIEEEPDLQVIFSTHSPYVVDEMDADEVYLLNTDKEGAAHAKKLSEHPDADRALQVLTTGEFWSAEGEEWVVDQNPSA